MKRSQRIITLVLGVLLWSSLACGLAGINEVRGSERMGEQEFAVAGFDKVNFNTIGELTIAIGQEETLRVVAEDNLLKYFKAEVRGDTLYIDSQENVNLRPMRPVKFSLTVKSLEAVAVNGSGDLAVVDDIEADNFSAAINGSGNVALAEVAAPTVKLTVAGSGDLKTSALEADATLTAKIAGSGNIVATEMRAPDVSFTTNGSGDLKVDWIAADTLTLHIASSGQLTINGGEVVRQTITLAGSGDYQAQGMSSASAEVRSTGSGDARFRVAEQLTAHLSGSGDIRYIGKPTVHQTVTGSGRVAPIKD